MEGKNAVIYARVSTTGQAEEELPIEGQVERCRKKVEELGATVVREFVDDGRSGRNDSRPAFQDIMTYCDVHSPDYLITWSTSRFFRNKIDAGLYKRQLDKLGVEIIYVSTPIDRESDTGWLLEGVLEIVDEWYSRQVSSDTMRSMLKNAHDGFWNGGQPPFGYKPVPSPDNPKRKKLVINDGEADLVKKIFKLRLDGHGAKAISVSLNQQGLSHRGKPWNNKGVLYILKSEAVTGQTVFGRRDKRTGRNKPRDEWVVVDSHKPIIEKEQWDTVQQIIGAASPNPDTGSPKSSFVFSGLLKCSCGATMQVVSGGRKNQIRHYYKCRDKTQYHRCDAPPIPAVELDNFLIEMLLSQALTPAALNTLITELKAANDSWGKDNQKRRQQLSTQLSAAKGKLERLYDSLETGELNLSDLAPRIKQHKNTIGRLEGEIKLIDSEKPPQTNISEGDTEAIAEELRYILTSYQDPKVLRAFFSTFVTKLEIKDGNVIMNFDKRKIITAAASGVSDKTRSGRHFSHFLFLYIK